jgi:hypothetical protein
MDAIAQVLNPLGQAVDEMITPSFIKIIGPQLARRFMTGARVKRTDDNRMGHGHDGPFLPPAGSQALVRGGQIRSLGPGGGMGDLGQARAQGAMALAGLARPLFAGTLVIPWGHPRPGRQATGRANASHIGAPTRRPTALRPAGPPLD